MEDESLLAWQRYQAGDTDAADELYDRYVQRLIALARSRISNKLARRVDPEDVVQSAYRSFFAHAQGDRFVLERSGDLWRLLSTITINKVLRQVQKHRRKKRSIDKEQSVHGRGDNAGLPPEVVAGDPSPQQALVMVEEMERVMSRLEPIHREVLRLRLQGESTEEIAVAVDRSERTIRRVLEKVRTGLEERLLESKQDDD